MKKQKDTEIKEERLSLVRVDGQSNDGWAQGETERLLEKDKWGIPGSSPAWGEGCEDI